MTIADADDMSMDGLSGQVRTDDGWAVPHAVLTVIDLTGNQISRVTADQDGAVSTEKLPAGNYTAIVTAVGHTPVARTAIVPASGVTSLGVVTLPRMGGLQLPPPGPWTIDPAHSSIAFTVRHLGMANVRGRFGAFDGQIEVGEPLERSSAHVVINAASIDTDNTTRDTHLRTGDFLDVEGFPKIEFHSTGLAQTGQNSWVLDGELTIRGATRPVRLDVSYQGLGADPWGATRAAFKATTDLHRDDFAVSWNQVVRAGVMLIGTTVRVELDVEAVQGTVLPGAEDDTTANQETAAPSSR
jgi:polyisoprenoid-binding protein YceI